MLKLFIYNTCPKNPAEFGEFSARNHLQFIYIPPEHTISTLFCTFLLLFSASRFFIFFSYLLPLQIFSCFLLRLFFLSHYFIITFGFLHLCSSFLSSSPSLAPLSLEKLIVLAVVCSGLVIRLQLCSLHPLRNGKFCLFLSQPIQTACKTTQ